MREVLGANRATRAGNPTLTAQGPPQKEEEETERYENNVDLSFSAFDLLGRLPVAWSMWPIAVVMWPIASDDWPVAPVSKKRSKTSRKKLNDNR
jgi:hypothetical protein